VSSEESARLADEAGFVFKGTVVRRGSADVDAEGAVTVEIEEVLRGTDVLRGLVGSEATVVTEEPGSLEPGEAHLFFTDCVSLGETAVLREHGRREHSRAAQREVAEHVRIAEERPLAERVAGADMIVTGEVTGTRPVAREFPPRSEHDPEWSIAQVAVESVLKGRSSRKNLEVLYASSLDIAWYESPKLEEGTSGILILRTADENETPSEVAKTVYQALHPLDFLPRERLPDVERLLEGTTEVG
jgi:hypothetical protein